MRLVEAGVWAPSGHNSQNQRFMILDKPEEIQALDKIRYVWPYRSSARKAAEASRRGILAGAVAAIVVFSDDLLNHPAPSGEYYIWGDLSRQNCSAAMQNILLMATALGIGSVWISATEQHAILTSLDR